MSGGWNHVLRANPVPGDVVAALLEMGVDVFKVDREEAQAPCPAHYERTGKEYSRGDWSVNTDDGMHNCFSCGFSGYFVDIVQHVLSISREEAVQWTRARGGIERVRRSLGQGSDFENEEALAVDESDLALFTRVPEWACDERSIDPGAADEYRVLWDPDKDLWITCIREYETDRLIGWQEKNKRHFNNYPKHMEKSDHVYGINDVPDDCDVGVVVESPLDCPYILSADIEGAVSTMGAGISEAQLDILVERFPVLISALDNDKSGDQTNADLRQRVGGRANLRFWNYGRTRSKDPGEQTYREARESYKTAYSSILARF
jgi:hypothetical protein